MIDALQMRFSEPVVEQVKVVAYVVVVAATVAACATAAFFTFQAASAALVAGGIVKAYAIRGAAYGLAYSNIFHLVIAALAHAFANKDNDSSLTGKVVYFLAGVVFTSAVYAGIGAAFGGIIGREVAWLSSSA